MTGGGLLELILLSMAWLFFVGGIAANWHVLRRQLKRKSADQQVPSGHTIPALAKYGAEVPWPWLWIVLPLVIDPYCLGGFLLLLLVRK